jgi:uncharacterized protein YqcC (DUF446 family)
MARVDSQAPLNKAPDQTPPSTEALASDQPFCVDTLTLPRWLQFIFLPTLYDAPHHEGQANIYREVYESAQDRNDDAVDEGGTLQLVF